MYIGHTDIDRYEAGPAKRRPAVGFAVTVPSAPFCTSTTAYRTYVYSPGSCVNIASSSQRVFRSPTKLATVVLTRRRTH